MENQCYNRGYEKPLIAAQNLTRTSHTAVHLSAQVCVYLSTGVLPHSIGHSSEVLAGSSAMFGKLNDIVNAEVNRVSFHF
jgi:hypothetical protein